MEEAIPQDVTKAIAVVERIMRLRQEGTETLQRLWTTGDLPKEKLPCHDSCEGDITVSHEGTKVRGFCPVHMVEGICPLVDVRRRELYARMKRAGFGPKYHNPDPLKMRARAFVEEYLAHLEDNLQNGKGLILAGDVGTGKSMSLAYIAKELLEQNRGVWSVPMQQFVEALADREARRPLVQRAMGVEVLMLDDFGAGEMAPWVVGILEGIIEFRYANHMPTFVATNLTKDMLRSEPLFRRMIDRWRETNKFVNIGGSSQRGNDGSST